MRALEATMDGYEVLSMEKAAPIGDIFVTATGDKSVIRKEHIEAMKDGAILANTGHFNVEIDIPGLRSLATDTREARAFVEEFTMAGGQRIYLIADGRLVNLSAAEGHPAARNGHVVREPGALRRVCDPERRRARAEGLSGAEEIDKEIARLKLATMGVEIDTLTEEQEKYLASWTKEPRSNGHRSVRGGRPEGRPPRPASATGRRDRARMPVGRRGRRGDPRAGDSGAPAIGVRSGLRARARGRAWRGPRWSCRAACRFASDRPSISPGRSSRCGTTRPPDALALCTKRRSSAATRWPHTRPSCRPGDASADALQCRRTRDGGYGSAVGALRTAWERGCARYVRVGRRDPSAAAGARLTAWELEAAGIPHAVIADSAAGSLMAAGMWTASSPVRTGLPRTATLRTRSARIRSRSRGSPSDSALCRRTDLHDRPPYSDLVPRSRSSNEPLKNSRSVLQPGTRPSTSRPQI